MFEWVSCSYMKLNKFKIESGYLSKNTLFYITKGEMFFSFEEKTETAQTDELISFPEGVYFEREIVKQLEFYHVRFENRENLPLPKGKISVTDKARLLSTLNYMCNLELMPDENLKLKNYFLNDIFVQLDAGEIITNAEKDEIVRKTADFFKKNLGRKITLEETAEKVGMSPSGLIYHFKNAMGTTPFKYLAALRIKQAETLLCHTNFSIAAISEECGFENSYYFCNTFKKYKSVSPSSYRKKYGI